MMSTMSVLASAVGAVAMPGAPECFVGMFQMLELNDTKQARRSCTRSRPEAANEEDPGNAMLRPE